MDSSISGNDTPVDVGAQISAVETTAAITRRSGLGCLTVLIPAYNEEASIAETLQSLKAQSRPADRILVVDDGSKDRTAEIARSYGVDVIATPRNTGSKSGALNHGIQFVDDEFVLTIDADTFLAPDALEKVMAGMQDPNVGVVCGFVIPRYVRTIWERGRYIEYLFAFGFYKQAQDQYNATLISSGCFSMFRTADVKAVGGWSHQTVGEDMDLTWKIRFTGKTVRFVPEAVCYPIEPHNYHFLSKQLKRWTSGFVQCIAIHWREVLRQPVMRVMVVVGVWDALYASLIMFVAVPILAVLVSPWFLLFYIFDFPAVAVPSLYMGAKRGEFWRALVSLPSFFVLRLVNAVYMLRAMWREWIVRKSLLVFEKGH